MQGNPPTNLQKILNRWKLDLGVYENIAFWKVNDPKEANLSDFPPLLHPVLRKSLLTQGYFHLFSHQNDAYRLVYEGKNIIVSTGTASGKSLCYMLPVLDLMLKEPAATALFLFPTKALAQDQITNIRKIIYSFESDIGFPKVTAGIYDGDTPASLRSSIRSQSRIVISNPDMLHKGILPHHTKWADFFRNLRFVVVDEIHTYRGVFGSHLANVLRRLKRITGFYGSRHQYIMTSATIVNARQFGSKLIEDEVHLISQDGSPYGERDYILYNPPIIEPELGLRKSASSEVMRLTSDLLAYNVQTIIFTRARRSVELLLRNLQSSMGSKLSGGIHGYRSGYLPSERRLIEGRLRKGEARAVVATNALELGIDIGSLDAAILVGFPGSVASTMQQFGRAGRKTETSLGVLVASASPLDQYIISHPEYIFGRSPEQALINPDNLVILLSHLRCAAFELPFQKNDWFGNLPVNLLDSLLQLMVDAKLIHFSGDKYYWVANQYPAESVSLRSADGHPVMLQSYVGNRPVVVGEVDFPSVTWMAHPGAVYLHEGRSYLVEQLDLENRIAHLIPLEVDYYTEPQRQVTIEKILEIDSITTAEAAIYFGEILVTSRVIGFKRVKWNSNENLGMESLDMPPSQLRTAGAWLVLGDPVIESLRQKGLWRNDRNDYGPNWNVQKQKARERDNFTCQVCGAKETHQPHHVHHKVPFRSFPDFLAANRLDNLLTLCPACHLRVEQSVRIRSGLAGLGYLLHQLAPLLIMCDYNDLGSASDVQSPLGEGKPTVVIYDQIPAGIGLSEQIFKSFSEIAKAAYEHIQMCPCQDGCPSCVGPGGENGLGGKQETLAILSEIIAPRGLEANNG